MSRRERCWSKLILRLSGCGGARASRLQRRQSYRRRRLRQCSDYFVSTRASSHRRMPTCSMRRPASRRHGSNWRPPRQILQQAEANNVKAQNDLGRYKQLVDKQEISQQQYDQAVAAREAECRRSCSRARYGGCRASQVTQAQGKLRQAEADQRSAATGPNQSRSPRARAVRCGRRSTQESRSRSGADLNLAVHKNHRAGSRNRQQPHRRSGTERAARAGADERDPARRKISGSPPISKKRNCGI